jgi:hypothetical protein
MVVFPVKKVLRRERLDFKLCVLWKMVKILLKYLRDIIFLFLHKNNMHVRVVIYILNNSFSFDIR